MQLVKMALSVSAVCALAACNMEGSQPSEAKLVNDLPNVPMSKALMTFRSVCVDGKSAPTDGSLFFKRETLKDGRSTCEMHARPAVGEDPTHELTKRYGASSYTGGATFKFEGYPNGPLFYAFRSNASYKGRYVIALTK